MIIRRFVKSGKSIFIVILLFVIGYMALMIDGQVRTQMQYMVENAQLKAENDAVAKWRECMKNTNLYTIDGEKYSKLTEIQSCGD